MKKSFIAGALLIFFLTVLVITKSREQVAFDTKVDLEPESSPFTLKKGDILVRPNWGGSPGSIKIANGRRFGHVAVVVEGSIGNTIDEALSKAFVIEALWYDQATRRFLFFKPENQIREIQANISFSNRFRGIRYRLRANLSEDQVAEMIVFLKNQTNCSYNLFSRKKCLQLDSRKKMIEQPGDINWHCATLAWEAFYLATGTDIDANKGLVVYPSDLIACKVFNQPEARIRF